MDDFFKPSAPWFERPEPLFTAELEKRTADPALCEAAKDYRRTGYLIRDFGFAPDDIDQAAEYTRTLRGKAGRVQDGWMKSAAVKRLATHQPVLDFLETLYERRAFPFQTLNFAYGSEQAAHADTYHFDTTPMRFMCGVWVALEDVQPQAGPLHYYPGSHALPVFTNADLADSGYDEYNAFVLHQLHAAGYEKTTGLLKKGQALVWSANLFHGGEPRSDSNLTRLSQVTHYYFDGCIYHTPIKSDPKTARMIVREPYDIARGKFVASRDENGPVYPRLFRRLRHRIRITARIPIYS